MTNRYHHVDHETQMPRIWIDIKTFHWNTTHDQKLMTIWLTIEAIISVECHEATDHYHGYCVPVTEATHAHSTPNYEPSWTSIHHHDLSTTYSPTTTVATNSPNQPFSHHHHIMRRSNHHDFMPGLPSRPRITKQWRTNYEFTNIDHEPISPVTIWQPLPVIIDGYYWIILNHHWVAMNETTLSIIPWIRQHWTS